jgi:hypothetical protein
VPFALDHQPVPADDDVSGSADRFERTEQGDLDFQLGHFGEVPRREARIGRGGRHRAAWHHAPQGSSASMWPMQPRSSLCLWSDTKTPPLPFGNRLR